MILLGLLFRDLAILNQSIRNLAIREARAHFQKDKAFRFWAATHGGFYVPITEHTPPSPYLAHIPERDIETPSGKKLTLMNPAWALRQMNEDFLETYGVFVHITSLLPIRPENAPDGWERLALESFETGETEVLEFVEFEGKPSLRLMKPLITQEGCLKCHAHQGYVVGDVGGGVSVAIPIAAYFADEQQFKIAHILPFIMFWLLGFGVIIQGSRVINKNNLKRKHARRMLQESHSKLEIRVAERTALLEATNKELEAFSYSVSHDLRAPLTRMDGFSKALQTKYEDKLDKKGVHYLNRIRASSQLLAELIDDLLTLSRVSRRELKKEMIDLSLIAKKIVGTLQSTDKDRKVEVIIQPNVKVTGDAGLLKAMMENLLNNAWKFTREEKLAKIDFGTIQKEGKNWIFVKDNGIGFNMKYYDKLFTPFQRLHSGEYMGSGIGLSTVQRIISKHGGQIHAESESGKGTTFYFII